jgi:hypothetical protein
MPTSSLVHGGRGYPSGATSASQATSNGGWKHAGLTPGWKPSSTTAANPGDSALAKATNARFGHVHSSGYARVRPAVTAADIHAELDATREELHYHATVVTTANERIALLEETHQSTTREFHQKNTALEQGVADAFTRLDEVRIAAQHRRVDADVARLRLEGLRAEVAKLEEEKDAELDAIATARDDFNVRAEELGAIEMQFEGRNKRLVDAVDTEKSKQEELMRQLVKVRAELEEAVERQRALKNMAAHTAAAGGGGAAARRRPGGDEARATTTAAGAAGSGASGQVMVVGGRGAETTPGGDDDAPEAAPSSNNAAYVLHPDIPMPPPGRRRAAYFKSKAGAAAAAASDLDDDDPGGGAFGWLGVDDLILVSGGGNGGNGGGGARARGDPSVGTSGGGGGGGLLAGGELETARAVHDSVVTVLSGSKNEELHLWDIFQHYCTVGMQTVRKPTDRGMTMSMAQFSRFIAECVERARTAASRRGASAMYSEAHLAAYNSMVDVHSGDIDLLFTGILAQEQKRKRRGDLRARQASFTGAGAGGFGGGVGGGGQAGGAKREDSNGGGSTSPRDAMAEFEQFLSGVVRLAMRMRLPSVPEPGEGGSVEDSTFITGLGARAAVDEKNPDAYKRLASGATLHAGLPHVVSGFLRVLVFPFARAAGEELARVEEVVRRAPPPQPTLRTAPAPPPATTTLLSEEESDDDDY